MFRFHFFKKVKAMKDMYSQSCSLLMRRLYNIQSGNNRRISIWTKTFLNLLIQASSKLVRTPQNSVVVLLQTPICLWKPPSQFPWLSRKIPPHLAIKPLWITPSELRRTHPKGDEHQWIAVRILGNDCRLEDKALLEW